MFLVMARVAGYTIIELVITVAILGVLVSLGVPSFAEWLHNTQLRNGAESVLHGLQVARAEAVRRNGFVQFILLPGTGTSFVRGGLTFNYGRGWRVVQVTPPSGGAGGGCVEVPDENGNFDLQRVNGEEGTGSVGTWNDPAASNSVTFTPLGWIGSGNTSCGTPITQLNFDSSSLDEGRSRELRIQITTGGGIRLCDPQIGAGDPRGCI